MISKLITAASLLLAAQLNAAPPPNDRFDASELIPSRATFSVDGTTSDATREVGDPGNDARTVWYSWTAPFSGHYRMSGVSSDNPIRGYVFIGGNLLSGYYVTTAPISLRPMEFYAIEGQSYRFCIDDYVSGYVNFRGYPFTIGLGLRRILPAYTRFLPPLANDEFDSPLVLNQRLYRYVYTTNGSDFEPFEQDFLNSIRGLQYARGGVGGSWVAWRAPVTGTARLSARTPTNQNTLLVLGYGGNSIDSVRWVRAAYNGLGFRCRRGVTYRFYLLNQGDDTGYAEIRSAGR